jgi:2-keto-4-pentenoate hydratase
MAVVDPRLLSALRSQLARRERTLARGDHHVGWKLGMGERESIGGHIAVGHLTSATLVEPGQTYRAGGYGAELHADAEACVELAVPNEIARYGVALELVDLRPKLGGPESVVATNVFHVAVAFGSLDPVEPTRASVSLRVNGTERAADQWPADLRARITQAAEILNAAGECLRPGDLIITGSIVQVPIASGDHVAVAVDDHPTVTIQTA